MADFEGDRVGGGVFERVLRIVARNKLPDTALNVLFLELLKNQENIISDDQVLQKLMKGLTRDDILLGDEMYHCLKGRYELDLILCVLRNHPDGKNKKEVIQTMSEPDFSPEHWWETDMKIPPTPKFECMLCFDEFQVEDMYTVDCPQSHRFCFKDMIFGLDIALKENKLMKCPGNCQYYLTHMEVVQLGMTEKAIEKYREIEMRMTVREIENIVSCPAKNCNNMMILATPEEKEMCHCPGCGHKFCSKCGEGYHYGQYSCTEFQALRARWVKWMAKERAEYGGKRNKAVEERAKHLEIRQQEYDEAERWKEEKCRLCPKCSRVIERISGCSAMVCGRDAHGTKQQGGCGHKFNWNSATPYKRTEAAHLKKLEIWDKETLAKFNADHGEYARCDGCHERIKGLRYVCLNCPGMFSYCDNCIDNPHPIDHVFDIIHTPPN